MHFFTNANLVIKIPSTSQTSGSKHFSSRISNPLFLCTKCFDNKQPDALELAAFSKFGFKIHFVYWSRVSAGIYHVNCITRGSGIPIVGSYISFPPCILFIIVTVIPLCLIPLC